MNAHALAPVLPASSPAALDLPAARQRRDGLAVLLRAERTAAADFLLALADFDQRRGWEPLGHASLFSFLRVELGLSKGGAFWRMSAARLVQRHPQVIEPLRDGRLCMSTTAELAKVLTEANLADVLPRYFGLSAREAKEITAELQPRTSPPLLDVVTRLAPAPRTIALHSDPRSTSFTSGARELNLPSAPALALALSPPTLPIPESVRTFEPERSGTDRLPARRDDVEPLSADLRRLHVTVSTRLLEKIDAARDGLSHVLPNATTEQVLEAAIDLLLEKQARARGLVKRPRAALAAPDPSTDTAPAEAAASRHRRAGPREAIPAAIKRAVWVRDGGRCGWPLDAGGTCGSTHRLQLDHVVPWAKGGETTEANLRLVCSRHNALAARRSFGERCAERYAARLTVP
jgi:hypothetical protein